MHPKEIEKVVSLEPKKRYDYLIKKIADREAVYTLTTPKGEVANSNLDGKTLFPLWSDKEYAELCKVAGWEDYKVFELSLEDLESNILNVIAKSGDLLNIFPVGDKTGFVVDSAEFKRDLDMELENY
ncbi:DUF2750 domain-containing protein [Chryseobacterium sp. CBSDS_008]|uniref:DUF2750 domain-containing protein n=1 Tax=Chryseobacterium sp. CBSDS_008 TaxID=3415265 RepID=UPI003CF70EB8